MTEQPLHIMVLERLRNDIKNKKHVDRLPNERELSRLYDVSRSTIGKALTQLSNEGVIFQKQGSGSYINQLFVNNPSDYVGHPKGPIGLTKSHSPSLHINSEIVSFSVIKAENGIASQLLIPSNSFVYHITRVRSTEKNPISVENLFIPIALAPQLTQDDFKISFYDHVEKNLKLSLTKSFHTITVSKATPELSSLLKLENGDVTVQINELVFLDDGTPFQISIVNMNMDYFVYNNISEIKENIK